jgi:TolB protein
VRDAATETAGQMAATVISALLLLFGAASCGSAADDAPSSRTPGRDHPPARGARVSASPRPIALSSLHGRIAFSHGGDVWVANANGTRARRLTRRRGAEFDPSWSPDGRRIAYRDSRHGINRNDEIYVMNADGTHARNLTRSPYNEWSPSWSSDGGLIAFYSAELYVMRPDGTGARPITRVEAEYPAWSADGQRIAFMSAQPGVRVTDPNYDVFVANRDGSRLRQLTDWPGEDGWPAWSPDGRSIAFSTTHAPDGRGRYRVYLMDADGSHKRLLTRAVSGGFPVWSPDGKAIMFSDDEDHLWVTRPDGSGLRKLPLKGWLVDWRR